jgi:hypothetical protein
VSWYSANNSRTAPTKPWYSIAFQSLSGTRIIESVAISAKNVATLHMTVYTSMSSYHACIVDDDRRGKQRGFA